MGSHLLSWVGATSELKLRRGLLSSPFLDSISLHRSLRKMQTQVPLWGVDEVVSWVTKSGFQDYGPAFRECGVDGDMLLQLTDIEIKDDYQDACLDKLDRFIRGEAGSLKVDSPHSTRRADSGRSTPCSLLLPTSSSPTILNRFLKNRAVSIDSDIGSQST